MIADMSGRAVKAVEPRIITQNIKLFITIPFDS
jgi:hypothetical protein